MPTPTYDLLASSVLTTATSSVTFASISQDFRDLVLVFNGTTQSGGTGQLRLVFNGDTGNVYKRVTMSGSGISADSGSGNNQNVVVGNTNNITKSLGIVQIMDYSATDKHKTSLIRNNHATLNTAAAAVRYESTAAITQIVAGTNATNFVSGSTFHLYGIVA